jgi:hypothetical protein
MRLDKSLKSIDKFSIDRKFSIWTELMIICPPESILAFEE